MSADEDYVEAKQDAERARARLAVTAAEIKARLNPGSIAQEKWAEVREKVVDTSTRAVAEVKARPRVAAAVGVAVTAFLFRGLIGKGISALRGKAGDETEDQDRSARPAPRAKPRYPKATPRRPRPGGKS